MSGDTGAVMPGVNDGSADRGKPFNFLLFPVAHCETLEPGGDMGGDIGAAMPGVDDGSAGGGRLFNFLPYPVLTVKP